MIRINADGFIKIFIGFIIRVQGQVNFAIFK